MKAMIRRIFWWVLVLPWTQCMAVENGFEKEAIKSLADRVRHFQKDQGTRFGNEHWMRGTYYAGLMAVYESTRDPAYLNDCMEWGEAVSWGIADKGDNRHESGAYSLICGQIWYGCYQALQKKDLIQPTIAFLENPEYTNPLSDPLEWYFENTGHRFVDGLFTGPPALAMLYRETGSEKYADWMDAFFWDVYGALYDTEANLFYRDHLSILYRTENDKKKLWSRGNGWAFGGLARILKYLPETHGSYARYKAVFVNMAESLAARQQADGFWRTSLDDPDQFPMPESSGTGFFCYGIACGINMGILDPERYLPVVRKAWMALSSVVNEEGDVTWCQPPGGGPRAVEATNSTRYGAGIFLLAASEVLLLIPED